MYEKFYGLKEKPFRIVPNPQYLYLSPKHQNALTHLEYGLMERVGFILLTGEIGTGKTTLIRHILNQVESDMEVAVIFSTNVSADQLLDLILSEFEISADPENKVRALDMLYRFLIDKYAEDKRVLLIIDEAQNLSDEALEEVRMLSNLQSDDEMLLQIMLVGQSELKEKLRKPSLAQFTQRIAVNYHLTALPEDDTGRYISFRLKKAGGRPDIFTPDAVALIFKASGGIPRSINLLCDSALTYGFADELATIDVSVVEQVIKDKGDLGIPSRETETEVSSPAASPPGRDPKIEHRISRIEAQMQRLATGLKRQSEGLNQMDKKEKLTVAEQTRQLKRLILRERKRSAFLLTKYSQLKEKYIALQQARAQSGKVQWSVSDSPDQLLAEEEDRGIPSVLLPTDLEFPSDDNDLKL